MRNNAKLIAVLNILAYIGMLVVNGLANALPLNGKTTGELSDSYPNLFVPAGITFSIWGLIYLLLGMFVVITAVRAFRENEIPGGWGFILTAIPNMAWIFAWHWQIIPLSLLIMLALLAALIFVYLRMRIGEPGTDQRTRFTLHLPFSIYLGWISIATIANFTALFVDLGWDGTPMNAQTWTLIMMGAGVFLGMALITRKGDIFYASVIIWALLGIYLKRKGIEPVYESIVFFALGGMGLLAALGATVIMRGTVYRHRV